MSRLGQIYRTYINSIIATLAIHILVFGGLLFVELHNKLDIPLEALFIDLQTEEIKPDEKELQKEETSQQNMSMYNDQLSGSSSNRAVNLGDQTFRPNNDPFFDKEYAKEVAEAKKLASDVNRNLEKKIPEIGDVPMPIASTEGMTPEEAKRSSFKGKSNIYYLLPNRYHLQLPIPVYLAQGGGEVIVDIVVSRDGEVVSAVPRSNSKIEDLTILAYAKQAAEKTIFNSDMNAAEKLRGTITYIFVAQ